MEDKINILNVKGEETEALLNQKIDRPLIQVKDLPSQYKGYPKGTVISYTSLDLETLENLNTDPDLDVSYGVAELLDAIHCNTLPSEQLYFYDVMYIGILRKINAFGDTRGMLKKRCPVCGELITKTFDYTEIDFKQIQAPDLPMRMEVAGKQLEFAQLTMKEFLEIGENEGELGVYSRYIKNLPFEEADQLVKRATGIDIKKLRFVDRQLDYGMKPFIVPCTGTVVNPKTGKSEPCKEQVVLEVTSPFEVVFPEDELGGDINFEVQYG